MTIKTIEGNQNSEHEAYFKVQQTTKVEYDQLLSSAGEFGRFQVRLFFSTIPYYVFGAFAYFSQLFMTQTSSSHWCWIPQLENLTDIERRQLAIPLASNQFDYDRCRSYVANWSEVLLTGVQPNASWETQACQNGWEFNQTEIPYPTIGREQEWVCDRNSYQATAQSVFFVGSIVGGFLIGWVADRFGRIPAVVFANLIGCLGGIISIFAKDVIVFSICRFIVGMSYDNCMMMVYLLVLEYVAPKYRTLMGNIPFSLFFTLGLVILPWIALACGDWKTLSLATSVPMLIALLTPWIFPESPRWLLHRGRVDKAIDKVKAIAAANRTVIPEKTIKDFKTTILGETVTESQSMIDVLKNRTLRGTFICMCLLYMCCMAVFDGLVRSSGELDFDFFLSFTIVSLTEFPSIFILGFIMDFTGRKMLSVVTLLICAVFSVVTGFVGGGLASVLCAMVARFVVNMACNASLQWAAEVLPTPVRGSGVAIVHICGYVATVISPFIAYLNNVIAWLPFLVIGLISFTGALLSLSLPETAQKELPQTLLDSEELIRKSKLFETPCLGKKAESIYIKGNVNKSFELSN